MLDTTLNAYVSCPTIALHVGVNDERGVIPVIEDVRVVIGGYDDGHPTHPMRMRLRHLSGLRCVAALFGASCFDRSM